MNLLTKIEGGAFLLPPNPSTDGLFTPFGVRVETR